MKTILVLFLLSLSSAAFAIEPQFWEENTQQAFASGDPQSISISSDGEIQLAPQLKKIYEGTDAIIWKILADNKGNLYAATGNDGKIIKIDAAGKSSVFLDTNELEIQAMVIDASGNLFAATSPEGKVYKVSPEGTSKTFFDPDDKYIWSLTLDPQGNLYVGTGDQGKIYRVDKDGKGKLLLDTSENNITALAWDSQRKLLAGSDRSGILYSVDESGKAFVLLDSDVQQITSIFPAASGDIYFSAITGLPIPPPMPPRQAPTPQPQNDLISPAPMDNDQDPGGNVEVTTDVEIAPIQPQITPIQPKTAGASQLYRLTPDGYSEILYTSNDDQILDITSFRDNQLLISTGKKAKLISVEANKKNAILLKAPEDQMTSLLMRNGKIWVSTANPGNIYELVESHSASGTYFSDVKDTQTTSTWGQVSWKGSIPQSTTLNVSTRSGNTKTPDATWSDWQSEGGDPRGARIQNPRARFVQWKADLATTDPKMTPLLRSVSIAYLQQNLRPEITTITIHPPGTAYRKAQAFTQDAFAGMSDEANPDKDLGDLQGLAQSIDLGPGLGKREFRKGVQTITWNASDPNQDDLRYDVFYRANGEKTWKPLAKGLKERVFAWDTQTLPDGTYSVQISANDNASNPKDLALSASKESDPFDVDNSAPTIEVLKNTVEKGKRIIEVHAQDQYSPIQEVKYAVNPGEWIVVFPVDSISDSPSETYHIEINDTPGTDGITLKCTDRFGNTSTIRQKF